MNFETRHLIRWGIPGWIFILFIILFYWIFNQDLSLDTSDSLKILGFLVSVSFIGVPIGYLFHQIYFSFNWLKKNRVFEKAVDLVEHKDIIKGNCWGQDAHVDYFKFEYVWHRELLKITEDKRMFISDRYRHFLNTIHALGALMVSLGFSLVYLIIVFIAYFSVLDKVQMLLMIGLLVLVTLLLIMVFKGFKYYSNNLNHFQGFTLNDLLNGEFKEYEKHCQHSKKESKIKETE